MYQPQRVMELMLSERAYIYGSPSGSPSYKTLLELQLAIK